MCMGPIGNLAQDIFGYHFTEDDDDDENEKTINIRKCFVVFIAFHLLRKYDETGS